MEQPAKKCSKCLALKGGEQFGQRKRGDRVTLRSHCRPCEAETSAARRAADPAGAKAVLAAYRARNRELIAARDKAYAAANPERRADIKRKCRLKHKEANATYARNYSRAKRAADPIFRLRGGFSNYVRLCLKGGKAGCSWEAIVGYDLSALKAHLERQFVKGMSWENMGEWHIDHIIPLASFAITGRDDPEMRRAWALPNLRPLWAKDNLRKGTRVASLL